MVDYTDLETELLQRHHDKARSILETTFRIMSGQTPEIGALQELVEHYSAVAAIARNGAYEFIMTSPEKVLSSIESQDGPVPRAKVEKHMDAFVEQMHVVVAVDMLMERFGESCGVLEKAISDHEKSGKA